MTVSCNVEGSVMSGHPGRAKARERLRLLLPKAEPGKWLYDAVADELETCKAVIKFQFIVLIVVALSNWITFLCG